MTWRTREPFNTIIDMVDAVRDSIPPGVEHRHTDTPGGGGGAAPPTSPARGVELVRVQVGPAGLADGPLDELCSWAESTFGVTARAEHRDGWVIIYAA